VSGRTKKERNTPTLFNLHGNSCGDGYLTASETLWHTTVATDTLVPMSQKEINIFSSTGEHSSQILTCPLPAFVIFINMSSHEDVSTKMLNVRHFASALHGQPNKPTHLTAVSLILKTRYKFVCFPLRHFFSHVFLIRSKYFPEPFPSQHTQFIDSLKACDCRRFIRPLPVMCRTCRRSWCEIWGSHGCPNDGVVVPGFIAVD
jgi:hypothetical protein